ncbi:hypothetical protein PPH41_43940, partial [Burkholderia gladioli]|nr:hypothetical protein [Burkholderia gladioli]
MRLTLGLAVSVFALGRGRHRQAPRDLARIGIAHRQRAPGDRQGFLGILRRGMEHGRGVFGG